VWNVVKDLTAEISEKVPLTVASARVYAKFRPVVWSDDARQARFEGGNICEGTSYGRPLRTSLHC
jgi:hypothetical protein